MLRKCLSCSVYEVLQVSEKVTVILWSDHQRRYKTFYSMSVIINLCCADSVCSIMDFVSGSKIEVLK